MTILPMPAVQACATQDCRGFRRRNSAYCLHCIREQRDLEEPAEPRPVEDMTHDYVMSCQFCSYTDYFVLTKRQACLLERIGVVCGKCGGSVVTEILPTHARSA